MGPHLAIICRGNERAGVPSHKVDVNVRSDGSVIEVLRRRPVRVLPTGDAGVVYAGEVFPLYVGDAIDLADKPYDKYDCNEFVLSGRPVPYAAARHATSAARLDIGRWSIEHNRFGNYLVFDADEDTAEAVAELVDSAGLGVVRWDASSRPADDGYHYDWFIRLKFAGTGDAARERVSNALAGSTRRASPVFKDRDAGQPAQATISADENARLMGIVQGLFAGTEEWRAAHAEVTTKAAQLEENLAEALKALRDQRQRTLDEQHWRARAENALAAAHSVRESNQLDTETALAQAIEQVEARAAARIQQADEDRRAAEQLGEEAEDVATKHRARILKLEASLTTKDAALAALSEQKQYLESYVSEMSTAEEEQSRLKVASRARKQSSGRTSADRFAEQVLPRLALSPDALDTLIALKDPSKVFAVLYALDRNDQVAATPFKGVSAGSLRIKEIDKHIHIGDEGKSSDMGRVYYCVADDRIFVHVHRKQNEKEQRQTVERFAGWCSDQLHD